MNDRIAECWRVKMKFVASAVIVCSLVARSPHRRGADACSQEVWDGCFTPRLSEIPQTEIRRWWKCRCRTLVQTRTCDMYFQASQGRGALGFRILAPAFQLRELFPLTDDLQELTFHQYHSDTGTGVICIPWPYREQVHPRGSHCLSIGRGVRYRGWVYQSLLALVNHSSRKNT